MTTSGLAQYQALLFELAEQRRQNGISDRVGHIHEVQKDKVRVVMGIKQDGTEWLSPWLHTENHRGGSRERLQYVKGQSVRINAPGGDLRQGTVSPWAESKSFPAPDHAEQVNGDSWQLGKLRVSKNRAGQQNSDGQSGGSSGGSQQQGGGDNFYDIWIADSEGTQPQQAQSGQEVNAQASAQGSQSSQQQAGTPQMKLRVSEQGYITGRVGTDARFSAHQKGVKLKFKNFAIFVDEAGCWSTQPIQVKGDPIPDDNN